jgi:hypothetical protein
MVGGWVHPPWFIPYIYIYIYLQAEKKGKVLETDSECATIIEVA